MSSSAAIRIAALLVLVPLLLIVVAMPLTTFGFDSPGQGPGGDWARSEFDWWDFESAKGASGRTKTEAKAYGDIEREDLPRMPKQLAAFVGRAIDVIRHFRIAAAACGVLALFALLGRARSRRGRAGALVLAGLVLVCGVGYLRFGIDTAAREYWSTLRSGPFAGDDWAVGPFRTVLDTPEKKAWLTLPLGPMLLLFGAVAALVVGFVGLRRPRRDAPEVAVERASKPRRERRPLPKRALLVGACALALAAGFYAWYASGYRSERSAIRAEVTAGDWGAAERLARQHAAEHGPAFLHAALDDEHPLVRVLAAREIGAWFDRWETRRDEREIEEMTAHLIERLGDAEVVRSEVATALVFVKKGWRDVLLASMTHADARVRAGVVNTIGRGRAATKAQADRFLVPLLGALDDADAGVRREAALALLCLDERPRAEYVRILPLAMEAIERADDARREAYLQLEARDDARDRSRPLTTYPFEVRLPLTEAEDRMAHAVSSLRELDRSDADERTLAFLRDRLSDGREVVRQAAAVVLPLVDPDLAGRTPELLEPLVGAARTALLGPGAKEHALRTIEAMKRAGPEAREMHRKAMAELLR